MILSVLTPIVAVSIGLLLMIAGAANPRTMLPVRSFALAAVLAAVITHILPEAIAAGGVGALAVFALGMIAPGLLGRLGPALSLETRHRRLATELGFVGVLVHQVGDGLALGSFTGDSHGVRWDLLLGIGAHTVPLTAALALTVSSLYGRRSAVIRSGMMAAAAVAGVALTRTAGSAFGEQIAPWLNAAVAGLLVHMLTHDLPAPDRVRAGPLVEVVAIAAGLATSLLGSSHGEPEQSHAIVDHLHDLALASAPAILVGIGMTLVMSRTWNSRPSSEPRSPWRAGLTVALREPHCTCRVAPRARVLGSRYGLSAAAAFAIAGPELGLDTVLLGAQLVSWEFALTRLVVALVAALVVGGLLARQDRPSAPAPLATRSPPPLGEQLDELLIHSTPWIAAGLVIAALLIDAVPPDLLRDTPSWVAILLAVGLGLPAYICAPAATPVAAVLIHKGLPASAAIAGLLVGSACNRSVLLALRDSLGPRPTLRYVIWVVILALAAGAATSIVDVHSRGPTMDFTAWHTAAAILLGMIIVRAWWRFGLTAWLEPLHSGTHSHHQHEEGMPCTPGCHGHHRPQRQEHGNEHHGHNHGGHDHAHHRHDHSHDHGRGSNRS